MTSTLNSFNMHITNTEPLIGGLTNACLKVTANEGTYVWRPVSEEAERLGADREKECGILIALADYSFVPNLIESSKEGLLVQWFDGEVIQLTEAQPVAVDLMTRVHELPLSLMTGHISLQRLSYKERIQSYWSYLTPENQTPNLKAYIDYFSLQDDSSKFPECLCHNDIGAYNIIVTEDDYGLIDWEYASVGDPSQDLTTMIIANQFEGQAVIEQYCAVRGGEVLEWQAAFDYWRPWVCMIGALWFALGYQQSSEACYAELAERELATLLKIVPLNK